MGASPTDDIGSKADNIIAEKELLDGSRLTMRCYRIDQAAREMQERITKKASVGWETVLVWKGPHNEEACTPPSISWYLASTELLALYEKIWTKEDFALVNQRLYARPIDGSDLSRLKEFIERFRDPEYRRTLEQERS